MEYRWAELRGCKEGDHEEAAAAALVCVLRVRRAAGVVKAAAGELLFSLHIHFFLTLSLVATRHPQTCHMRAT